MTNEDPRMTDDDKKKINNCSIELETIPVVKDQYSDILPVWMTELGHQAMLTENKLVEKVTIEKDGSPGSNIRVKTSSFLVLSGDYLD